MPDRPVKTFWKSQPLFVLAPMEDVTDTAFRELVLRLSAPGLLHVVFTEFTSTDGLCSQAGRPRVEFRLKVSETERKLLLDRDVKIVAQVWGNKPEKFREAISYIRQNYSFDGIDINMGCPVKNVVAQGSCSALIANHSLASEIIAAAREASDLPLSVKTRTGIKQSETEKWIGFLLGQPVDAITIHGRTQKQMSQGDADWQEIGKAVALRNQISPNVAIIGNGDVETLAEAREKITVFQTDGVMVGRGIFKNPWLFNPEKNAATLQERIETLLHHIGLYEAAWGGTRHFAIMKRFFKIYITGFPGASELREHLMKVSNLAEARNALLGNSESPEYLTNSLRD